MSIHETPDLCGTLCWHCRLALPEHGSVTRRLENKQCFFCCHGCATAAVTIAELGLGEFYQFQDPGLINASEQVNDNELAEFDVEELLRLFVTEQNHQYQLRLYVEGIHCAACVWLIETALSKLDGVSRVMLNLATSELYIAWQGDELSPLIFAKRIASLGYRPRLPGTESMTDRTAYRVLLARLLVAGLGAMQAMMYAVALYMGAMDDIENVYRDFFRIAGLIVATPVVFFSGWPFLSSAWNMVRHRHLNMDVPVALALLFGWSGSLFATLTGGQHVYFESISMFVFFLLVSRWLEYSQRQKVTSLLRRFQADLPNVVTRLDQGKESIVAARLLQAGQRFRIAQGDIVPVDAMILQGSALIEKAALTGESVPALHSENDFLPAGARLIEGVIELQALTTIEDSYIAKINALVGRAQQARPVHSISDGRLPAIFVSGVLLAAGITFFIHPGAIVGPRFEHTLAVLVITCPCALALAMPLTVASMIGRALQQGVLISDPTQFLKLSKLKQMIFDKTGTLTEGNFHIVGEHYYNDEIDKTELKSIVAGLEHQARHPLATALKTLGPAASVTNIKLTHQGVSGDYLGRQWRIGTVSETNPSGALCVRLFADGIPMMDIFAVDTLRPESASVINQLHKRNIVTTLSSGDQPNPVRYIAQTLGLHHWYAEQTQDDKEKFARQCTNTGLTAMVGDGVNDARALLAADIGIAVNNSSALARDAAHVFLLRPGISVLPWLFTLAEKSRRILHQNLFWALGYNLAAIPFAMAGMVPPWLAALGMSLSSLIVTLNAARLATWK